MVQKYPKGYKKVLYEKKHTPNIPQGGILGPYKFHSILSLSVQGSRYSKFQHFNTIPLY